MNVSLHHSARGMAQKQSDESIFCSCLIACVCMHDSSTLSMLQRGYGMCSCLPVVDALFLTCPNSSSCIHMYTCCKYQSCQVSLYEPKTCAQDRVEHASHGSLYTLRDVQHVCDVYKQAKGLSFRARDRSYDQNPMHDY